jgi:hypothetical protein
VLNYLQQKELGRGAGGYLNPDNNFVQAGTAPTGIPKKRQLFIVFQ